MQERNIVSGFTSVVLSEFIDFLYPIRFIALLGLILVIVDLRFGIRAAIVRKEEIRFSRALRRTGNKIVDYTCWLLLAVATGHAFGNDFNIKIFPSIILAIIFGIEINSCLGNYFKSRGFNYKINVFKLFTGDFKEVFTLLEEKEEIEQKD